MYRELNPASRQRRSRSTTSSTAYREAEETATLRSLEADSPGDPRSERRGRRRCRSRSTASTVAFGTVEADVDLPYDDGGIAWDPNLVFPGLRRGEHLENEIELAPRAPILAADGTPLAEGAADAREHPLGSCRDRRHRRSRHRRRRRPAGAGPARLLGRHAGRDQRPRAGLQRPPRRQAGRLAARGRRKPAAPARVIAKGKPQARSAGEDDDRPRPAGQPRSPRWPGRSGGVAVLDARNGDVRALAGQAFSAPQPPGSTFKMITTTAALQTTMSSRSTTNSKSPTASTSAAASSKTRTASTAAAPSAKRSPSRATPTSPRSARRSATTRLVGTAERFGFNSPPDPLRAAHRPRRRTCPNRASRRSRRRSSTSASARSARGKCWRPRWRWRASRRRSATAGVRDADLDRRQQEAAPRRRAGAGDVEEDRRRADRTDDRRRHRAAPATRGRSPRPRSPARPGPPSSGRSPGRRTPNTRSRSRTPGSPPSPPPTGAKLAIGVLLIEAEAAGGEVAAPIASASSLGRDLAPAPRPLEVEFDLGRFFAFGAVDLERQRSVLRGRVGQQEEDQGALRSAPAAAVESSTGICSWDSTSPPSGKA